MSTVAIIGAGIGGVYLVAELGLAGHRLRLHDLDDTRLADIRAHGGVDVEHAGFAAVERATTDLAAAVDGADVIIVVTGGNAQATVARSLAPLLRDGQIILLIQGNTGGSLMVRRALDAAGCRAGCRCRRDGQLSVLQLALVADAHPADREEALAADRDISRPTHRVRCFRVWRRCSRTRSPRRA